MSRKNSGFAQASTFQRSADMDISCELPEELYDEIVGFLWNDIPSLKACSLANRIMTIPSQKRLFYCIALRPPLQKLEVDRRIFDNGLCHTSYNFRQLLLRSPHIAKYVISLHIVDHGFYYTTNSEALEEPLPGNTDDEADDGEQYTGYKLGNGQDISLDAALVPISGPNNVDQSRCHRWLPTDKFLPLFAPLLCNLRSLAVVYDYSWYHLSGKVLITLLNLIQLPSLRHLQITCDQRPDVTIKQAIGENVKHLVLYGYPETEWRPLLRLPHPPQAPVYLDSLSIRAGLSLSVFQDCRVQISKLRKLIIRDYGPLHVAIRPLLQTCSATLQDFVIRPSHEFERDVLATTSHDDGPEDPIDLSKLATLKRFSVSLRVVYDAETIQTPFFWLNRVLRSSCSTSANQQLEDILIRLYVSFTHPVVLDILHWKDIFDTFLEDKFKNLRNLKIFVGGHSEHVDMVVELLEDSVDVKSLRARRNLVVDIRGDSVPSVAPDVRWDGYDWSRWK